MSITMYGKIGKRIIDIVVSGILLILLLPIMAIFVIIGSIVYRSNPFFIQARAGKEGNEFIIYKLKSMYDSTDHLEHEGRLNSYGKFIRALSIDELPQLLNVLIGNMSLVGPRPLLVEYVEFYNDSQAKRLLVKPGITGWAQVKGRNALSWEDKFRLDTWYVENLSFFLDVRIILLTAKKLFSPGKQDKSEFTIVERFKGNK